MQQGRRTLKWWILRALAMFGAIVVMFVVLYFLPDSRIVASRETTYLTEPLDEEGSVDYLAAINQQAAEGVTPENNAAVLYWQALGPGPLNDADRGEFFRQLGIEPLPVEGEYFLELKDFQEPIDQREKDASPEENWEAIDSRQKQRLARRELMRETPWVREDDPLLAEWLDIQQEPIDLFIAGTLRAKHFIPKISEPEEGQDEYSYPMLDANIYFSEYRTMARTLMLRSMLHSGSGRPQEAWNDCLACLRLARHTANQPFIVEALVSYTLNAIATSRIPTILHEGEFTPEELSVMRQEFREQAACASIANGIDWGERLMVLDYVQHLSHQRRVLRGSIDWNQVLQEFNIVFDRMVAEMRRGPDESDLNSIEQEFESLADEWHLLIAAYPFSRQARTRMMTIRLESLLLPALTSILTAERRCNGRLERIDVAFALTLYRAQHQEYPETLAELVPLFLDAIPLDPFDPTGTAPVRYRRQDDGYSLWSVGRNGIDDKGRTQQDWEEQNDEDYWQTDRGDRWDDNTFRVPHRLPPMTDAAETTSQETPAGE